MENKLIYDIHDKPKFSQMLIFALQQLLAILAATIAVPMERASSHSFFISLYEASAFRYVWSNMAASVVFVKFIRESSCFDMYIIALKKL